MADKLTIITACSRLTWINDIIRSLAPGKTLFDLTWLVVIDSDKIPFRVSIPGAQVYTAANDQSVVGNAQKNAGLEMVADGLVYFLDDDNLIHPEFFPALAEVKTNYPDARGFVFGQDCQTFRRYSDPGNIAIGRVDLAQFVLDRQIIGDRRFALDQYYSDGTLITGVYNDNPGAFVFDRRVATYYNGALWAGG
jgi:hypothetical protein